MDSDQSTLPELSNDSFNIKNFKSLAELVGLKMCCLNLFNVIVSLLKRNKTIKVTCAASYES